MSLFQPLLFQFGYLYHQRAEESIFPFRSASNCSAWAVFMPDSSLIFSLSSNYFKIGDLYSLTNLLILLYLWICLFFSDYSLFVISFYSCQVLICSCNWFHVSPSGGRGMSYFSLCACLLSKSRRSLILYCICR